ncbi:uncharacterized protein LOC120477165 isoform X1 [Pimephales promelas]|uniref:uncharacterized protein LOC120477165 isoform X1 n=2 Tax=Pimephales promelas TaxID=90988 RepID=UPI0019555C11|nr:uncharacterized protein LOC120477165 isoform X1 [Pimephales promelas]
MARRILETILTTPDILNRIEEALGDRENHSENERRRLFNRLPQTRPTPAFQFARNFSGEASRGTVNMRRRCQRNTGGPFIREVCLLTSPETTVVPKGMARVQLLNNGYIISGVQFQKRWNFQQVLQHIHSIFESKLQLNTELEILRALNTQLVKPTLEPGVELTGTILCMLFKDRVIYVRPSGDLSQPDQVQTSAEAPLLAQTTAACPTHALPPSSAAQRPETVVTSQLQETTSPVTFQATTSTPQPLSEAAAVSTTSTSSWEQSTPQCSHSTTESLLVPLTSTSPLPIQGNESPVIYEWVNAGTSDVGYRVIPPANEEHSNSEVQNGEDSVVLLTDTEEETVMLGSPNYTSSDSEEADLADILRSFQKDHLDTQNCAIVVARRSKILHSACQALSKSYFAWNRTPRIEFVGESAEDHGGPQREFFRLLMIEAQSALGIFEGKQGQVFFAYNQSALEQNRFYTCGKLIAWSLIHGGPGIKSPSSSFVFDDVWTGRAVG